MDNFLKPILNTQNVLSAASKALGEKLIQVSVVEEGADSVVIKARRQGGEYVFIKVGPDVETDALVLKKLEKFHLKVPHFLGSTVFGQDNRVYPLLVMSACEGVLLKDVPPEDKYSFIDSILEEFGKFRSVQSPGGAGYVLGVEKGEDWSWKEFLLRNLGNSNPDFDWQKVLAHAHVDKNLLMKAIGQAKEMIGELNDDIELSLLHTDVNETNILVEGGGLTGVIDWSDAKYGDYLFDFARFRMNIRQNMNSQALEAYYQTLDVGEELQKREKTYYLLNVLEYTNWYVLYGWDHKVALQMQLLEEIIG